MPSPFPGMDPFIESQVWTDFHTRYMVELADRLTTALRPKYSVLTERRVYIESLDAPPEVVVPDLTLYRQTHGPKPGPATATLEPSVETTTYEYVQPVEHRETFLIVREIESARVVTLIELLSPSNKRLGSDGHKLYLEKREEILRSRTNLVEIDLLRGGHRLPMGQKLADRDYFVFVRRQPKIVAETLQWNLPSRLPQVPIPLDPPDPDAVIDLQAALDAVYDRAGYDYTLDYKRPIDPPLSELEQRWISKFSRP